MVEVRTKAVLFPHRPSVRFPLVWDGVPIYCYCRTHVAPQNTDAIAKTVALKALLSDGASLFTSFYKLTCGLVVSLKKKTCAGGNFEVPRVSYENSNSAALQTEELLMEHRL